MTRWLAIVSAVAIALGGCAASQEPLRPHTAADPLIRQLDVGSGTNIFVLMGAPRYSWTQVGA